MADQALSSSDMDTRLKAAVAATGVTGASLAYWDGERLHLGAAGLRNSVTGDPVTVDTIMHIGSITKIANAVLLLQLVDDGLVKLDDLVSRHLPELRLGDPRALERLTVQMLIDHRSGIDCEMLPDHGPDRERITDLVGRCAALTQLHPPGEGPSYSNIGTALAGYLVEKLRGKSWYSLMKERIFVPLNMRRSIVDPIEALLFRHSIGDLTDPQTGGSFQTSRPFLPLSFAPCGTTAMTTAEDLLLLGRALAAEGVGPNGARILSDEQAELMTVPTSKIVAPPIGHWGLGWKLLPAGVLHHAGGGPGVASYLYVHKSSGRALSLLTNSDRGHSLIGPIVQPILREWTGMAPAARAQTDHLPVSLEPYVGTYGNNLTRLIIDERNGRLSVRFRMAWPLYDRGEQLSPRVELEAVGPDHFAAKSGSPAMPVEFRFAAMQGGKAASLFHHLRQFNRMMDGGGGEEIPGADGPFA